MVHYYYNHKTLENIRGRFELGDDVGRNDIFLDNNNNNNN